MTANEQLITTFYKAFQQKNYKVMQECYADNAIFTDEVFVNLNAAEVRNMWEMLCKRGKDLQLEFKNITANEKSGTAEWIATYSFSKTNRKVVNRIKAEFVFLNGKIANHHDHFDFYNWAKQALGLTGVLFGWTKRLKEKVRAQAKKSLTDFMNE